MEKSIITFSANEQNLQKTGGIGCYASDTVSYIEAQFALGENWSGYDSIRAVWFNDYKTISTVLDFDGVCIVPHEVLVNRGEVMVNLVGSVLVSDELTDRLTTFPCEALKVSAKAKISGSETAPITPSQFEQFVGIVISEVEKVTGMTAQAETLPAGSQATARYENGILYLGIPQGIRGERGETGADGADGNGIASVVYNADYSLTLVFDNGEQFTTPPIRGERGPAGADGTDGRDGADGVTPNISIGNVTTLEPSEDAYVTRRGTDDNPIFDFGIPKGDPGTVPDLDLILPTDTASGDIASITDGQSVVPVKSLKVTLEPIQSGSGTPSPDNVRPISGRTEVVTVVCGKNLFDVSEVTEASVPALGEIRGSTLITKRSGSYSGVWWLGWKQKLTENDVVSISADVLVPTQEGLTSKQVGFGIVKSDETNIGAYNRSNVSSFGTSERLGATVTVPKTGEYYIRLQGFGNVLNEIVEYSNIQLELGSTATAYEPYQGTTYTTTLGRTVYGGTLDVVSGELVVDRAMVTFDGTESGAWGIYGQGEPHQCFNRSLSGKKVGWQTSICNQFPNVNYAFSNSEYGIYCDHPSNDTVYFRQPNADVVTVTDWRQWLSQNPIQLCYELATPQTYQLDPQTISLLHGNNNVWSDGIVELTYNADVQLWVLKQLGTSGTRTLSMTRTLAKSETNDTKSDNIQLAED